VNAGVDLPAERLCGEVGARLGHDLRLIGESFSLTAAAYRAQSESGEQFFVKRIPHRTPISAVVRTPEVARTACRLANVLYESGTLITSARCVLVEAGTDGATFVLEWLDGLSPAEVHTLTDLGAFARAIRELHDRTASLPFRNAVPALPSDVLTATMRDELLAVGREQEVVASLNAPAGRSQTTVICHNDLHPANVFRVEKDERLVILDLGEICRASPLLDLGIVVANYLPPSADVEEAANAVLDGYGWRASDRDRAVEEIAWHSRRKLLLIEGYWLWAQRRGAEVPPGLYQEIQRRHLALGALRQ
jgi:aminoglycoside phosphotransferase (APT) family kinase protein